MEGTRTFLFLFQGLTKLGGGKVCVGLGTNQPMMMRSDQEIPFPRTLGSLKLGGRCQSVKTGQGQCGVGVGQEEQSQKRKY